MSGKSLRLSVKSLVLCSVLLMFLIAISNPAWAAEESAVDLSVAINTVWTLLAGFLVFFMHAGFAMVESGFTRTKNVVNIIMKNVATISLGVVVFFLVGFALMFGPDAFGLVGVKGFGLTGAESFDFGLPLMAFWFFQAVFAATCATIVSGAVAERTHFASYLAFTVVIVALIYPVVGHWVWGGGWLAQRGFVDFAGSTVVHSVGGWSALIGAWLVGPRLGKYGRNGEVNPILGHNFPMGALGVLILWLGWFGFNAGSTLSGTTPLIAHVATTTILAGASGCVSAIIFSWVRHGKSDPSLSVNGILAGLVGITAGTASVSPTGALVIGGVAGIILVLSVEMLDRVVRIDDPVGAISVHGVCGAFGTLAVGLFATEGGLFYGGGLQLLGVQALGVLSVAAWTLAVAFATFSILKASVGLRVNLREEMEGLDLGEHGLIAYGDMMLHTLADFRHRINVDSKGSRVLPMVHRREVTPQL